MTLPLLAVHSEPSQREVDQEENLRQDQERSFQPQRERHPRAGGEGSGENYDIITKVRKS